MKKFTAIILSIITILTIFAGCSKNDANISKNGSISIVCTMFPQYDWITQILGTKNSDITYSILMDNGVDLHSYQPTAEDMIKIAACDMFVYVGGESDKWVDDALKEVTNKDMVVINLMNVLGDKAKEEEVAEGMETPLEENDSESPELDEHVWLSLKNAKLFCSYISKELCKMIPQNEKTYKANTEEYLKKLDTLDAEYETTIKNSKNKTLVFGDRFPFRYMIEDYNLKYYAAFMGCSAETEASFETIVFLAKKIDEACLRHIVVIDGSDQSIAKTIIKNTKNKNQDILTMDSAQALTLSETLNGKSYLSIMQENLEVLKQALN